jgi:glycosyltransferase involved in cell wall biosynthesis
MKTKLTLLCRLRNESLLLPDFLKHVDPFIDEAFWFDDCSDDNTVDILKAYPKTVEVMRNYFHNPDQSFVQTSQRKLLLETYKNHTGVGEETVQRNKLLEHAQKNSKNKWFILIEPDERIDFDFSKLDEYDKQGIGMIYFRLFDAYITKDDDKPYSGEKLWNFRKYFGPEYRNIGYVFDKDLAFYDIGMQNCRQPYFSGKSIIDGLVQHYGKAISKEHWEKKCEYYITHVPALAEKWSKRKGMAVHTESDFRRPLLTWKQIIDKRNFKKLIQI